MPTSAIRRIHREAIPLKSCLRKSTASSSTAVTAHVAFAAETQRRLLASFKMDMQTHELVSNGQSTCDECDAVLNVHNRPLFPISEWGFSLTKFQMSKLYCAACRDAKLRKLRLVGADV